MISGVDHITINVWKKEESLRFYEEILGLKKIEVIDMGDQEITYFRISENIRLELIEYDTKIEKIQIEQKGMGCYRHLAFKTNDLESVYQRCIQWNVRIRMKPTVMEKLSCTGMLIEDPNGVEIEIVEKIK